MADKSAIEWTDATWNPIRGCSRVSEGCRNCYAEKVAYRFSDVGAPYHGLVGIGGKWNGQIRFIEDHLLDPLKWKKPRRIFVNSMSDLFHENVAEEWLDKIFAVMALCPQHTFQVLTKRPERMLAYLRGHGDSHRRNIAVYNAAVLICAGDFSRMSQQMGRHRCSGAGWWPLPNVQLGVSVENQKAADERIPLLLQTTAAVRFISAEPLLNEVSLKRIRMPEPVYGWVDVDATSGDQWRSAMRVGFDGPKLDWVICGGESGPGARPMHPDWARALRDQCMLAGVPFFFKQWGAWRPCGNEPDREEWCAGLALVTSYHGDIRGSESLSDQTTEVMRRTGKKIAGALLDGREWREFPA